MNRGSAGDGELAGVGAGVAGVDILLAIEAGADFYHLGRDIQRFGDDLRGDGFVALALRDGAEADYHFAVDIELGERGFRLAGERGVGIDDLRLAEIIRAGIESAADADAEVAAFFAGFGAFFDPLVPVD